MREECLEAGKCLHPENCQCHNGESTVVVEQGMFGDIVSEFGIVDPTSIKVG